MAGTTDDSFDHRDLENVRVNDLRQQMAHAVKRLGLAAGSAFQAVTRRAREIAVRQEFRRLPVVVIAHEVTVGTVVPLLAQQQLGKLRRRKPPSFERAVEIETVQALSAAIGRAQEPLRPRCGAGGVLDAPKLLTHGNLTRATRDRLERAACRQAEALYRVRHLLPEVVNPDILQVAMVEAVIRRSSHSKE